MKKLGLVLSAFIVAVWFGACGDSKDSKDLGESQTINANDSQGESNESSADSNIDSIKSAQDFNVLHQNATICDDSYNKKVCGGDALLCSANKCLYKNLTNIDEAFKFYVGQKIKKIAFSKERDERNVLVYKYMLGIALPKENESKKKLQLLLRIIILSSMAYKINATLNLNARAIA
ncbi:hypothetical protein [Helicobacter sp. T3_23-1056]